MGGTAPTDAGGFQQVHMMANMTTTEPNPRAEVLILQHLLEDGPGFLGDWLARNGHRAQVLCTEAGEAYPASVRGYRGLTVLGGAWGANDERPSLRQAEALIREADALGVPVIGHCLGGQLIARAFGGRVQTLPVPEIGWLPMRHNGSAAARAWLGDAPEATVFQWHYDSFVALPPGAQLLAGSGACAHQAFALRQHLAMQFHVEITPGKVQDWLAQPGQAYAPALAAHPATVQSPAHMLAASAAHQAGSQALASHVYSQWRARWKPV